MYIKIVLFLINLGALSIFLGCNSSDNESKAFDSSNSNSSSALNPEIVVLEEIELNTFLDTPIQIIDNQESLNQLYVDLNLTQDNSVEINFENSKVIYIQRSDIFNVELNEIDSSLYIDTTAVELFNHPYLFLRAQIVFVKNIFEKELFFSKTTKIHKECYSTRVADSPSIKEINSSILSFVGIYKSDSIKNYNAQVLPEVLSLEENYINLGIAENAPTIDLYTNFVFSSGFLVDTKEVSYKSATLEKVFLTNTSYCQSPAPSFNPTNTNVEFAIEGVRSDCLEHKQDDTNVSLYSIAYSSMKEHSFPQAILNLSVRSCTGYTTSPFPTEMLWYQERENLVEVTSTGTND